MSVQKRYTKKGLNGIQSDQAEFFFGNNSFSGTDMLATMTISGTENVNGSHVLGSIQTLSYSIHQNKYPVRSIGNINAKDYVMGPRTIAGSLVFAVFDRHFAYAAMEDIQKEYKNYHFLADEMPPFDITITYANEYGANSKLALYGVRLVNEGQVMSINDIYTENTYQFVATDIDYLDVQNLYSPIFDKEGSNIFAPQTIPLPQKQPELPPSLDETFDPDDMIVGKTYTLEIKNIQHVLNNKKGSAEIYIKPGVEQPTQLTIRSVDTDTLDRTYSIYPDSQFPIFLGDLEADRYEIIFEPQDAPKIFKSFIVDEQIEEEVTLFNPHITIYEKGSKEITCYIRCLVSESVDALEYISKEMYEQNPNGIWQSKKASKGSLDFLIEGLSPKTIYYIRAVKKQLKSDKTTFMTTPLDWLSDRFDNLKDYIHNNRQTVTKDGAVLYDVLIDLAKAYAQEHAVTSMAEAFLAIKTDENKEPIDYCIYMALAYENDLIQSSIDGIQAPYLISAAQACIGLHTDTDFIEIEKLNGCPMIIHNIFFNKTPLRYFYHLQGGEGLFKVKRCDIDGRVSPEAVFAIYDQKFREALYAQEQSLETYKLKSVNRMRTQLGEALSTLSKEEREIALLEYAQENDHFKTGLLQPIIVEQTDYHIRLKSNLTTYDTVYCCIQRSEDLLSGKPIHKVSVSKNDNYLATFETLKHALCSGVRYSVWYETTDFVKISPIYSFVFNTDEEQDVIIEHKQKVLKEFLLTVMHRYVPRANHEFLFDYLIDKIENLDVTLYSHYSEIYATLLLDIYTNKDISKKDTYTLIHYMMEIFLALNHESQKTGFAETNYHEKTQSLIITPHEPILIHRVVLTADGLFKEEILQKDAPYALDLNYIGKYGQVGFVYYTSLDYKKVSKPFMIDYDYPTHVYGSYKESVGKII